MSPRSSQTHSLANTRRRADSASPCDKWCSVTRRPPVVRLVHFVRECKQLLGIANRVERQGRAFDAPATPIVAPK